jgi:hypothetical protein
MHHRDRISRRKITVAVLFRAVVLLLVWRFCSCSWRRPAGEGRRCRGKSGQGQRRHAGEGGAPGGDVSAWGTDVQGPAQGRERLLVACTGTGRRGNRGATQGRWAGEALQGAARRGSAGRAGAGGGGCDGGARQGDAMQQGDGLGNGARATALYRKQIASRRSCCGLRVLARTL